MQTLSRTVGVPGAVLLGLGSMLGTGVFVGVALAADVAGPAVVPATLAAAALALCNALSSAQLAAAYPVSGGTYEYGHRLLGARGWPGFLAGWLFLGAKGASAATAAVGLCGYLLALFPPHLLPQVDDLSSPPTWLIGAGAAAFVVAMTAFVAGGLRRSNSGNAVLVTMALVGLGVFLLSCPPSVGVSPPTDSPDPEFYEFTWEKLASAAALMFVAFAGYGRLATLGEEVTNPARNIPKAVLICVAVTAVLYVWVAASVVGAMEPAKNVFMPHSNGISLQVTLPSGSEGEVAPLTSFTEDAVQRSGSTSRLKTLFPALVTAGAFAALGGSLLNLLLGLSRVLLAMARRGEMPPWFAQLSGDGQNESPRRAVWTVGLAVAAVAACGSVKLAWSVSACAVLLYYGLTNAAALRLPAEQRRYPRAIAWVGLIGCASLAWFVTPVAAGIVGGWLVAGAAWRAMMGRRTSPGRAA